MDENLITRLESAVTRLEALSARQVGAAEGGGDAAAMDPSIVAFDDLIYQYVNRVMSAAEKIGGQVLDVSKIIEEAFNVRRNFLLKSSKLRFAGADSLAALAWIAYTGKDCGMSMPIAHVEESWQMAEFYSNKILVEYRNKDANHVEWAKALKELYVPGLRDYVKTQPSSSRPKEGMAAVFQEINSGKPVTSGLRKVTADMKTKNRTDRTGVVSISEKESRAGSTSISKTGAPKLELQMGESKWVVENQIGRNDLVIDDCDAKQSVYVFGCKNSVLQIQGKVNNITVDKCTKMGWYSRLSPTISIDNTGGCQLYLSKDSLEASITTAKSSEVNVLVPASETDGDWVCFTSFGSLLSPNVSSSFSSNLNQNDLLLDLIETDIVKYLIETMPIKTKANVR
ncbi:hypothetical protein DH2020_044821 [Rehmannia glutinosa]|uniref:Adenylyl cyclase-associated protein n=1 Tax=Rehmannia glutinosa TaxID=99300 RepID=A0ABR0UFW6_REHGL